MTMTTTLRKITVSDLMQSRYSYALTEPMGKNFDPRFKPQLTPKQMLTLGVFGGIYMRDCTKEFPADWFTHAKLVPLKGSAEWPNPNKRNPKLNCFGVNASQPLSVWKKNGWIYHEDPRGWFQWYCRYYMGRRIPAEDDRQIKRWVNMRRHITQIANNCRPGDIFCRPRQRQAVLHWAYDARKI